MKKVWYSRKWVIVTFHALVWMVIFALPFLLFNGYHDDKPHPPEKHNNDPSVFYICKALVWILFFYFTGFIVARSLMYKKQYGRFIASQLIIWVCLFVIDSLFTDAQDHLQSFFIGNLFPYLFFLACSLAFVMSRERIKMDKLAKEKENENLKTELAFLRSQVSPHFMFNVLNNMVSMARKQSDQLEPSLIKLSSLMRYMLYETDERMVALDNEIEYLQNYIDLQQQRFGNRVKITFNINVRDGLHEIHPMLLIPFVENAFKHGTGKIEDAQIEISITAENNLLRFTVRNKFDETSNEVKDHTSGIGLNNVKRRLSLLYPQKHMLSLSTEDKYFIVNLQINMTHA